jgi:hypothetical protein
MDQHTVSFWPSGEFARLETDTWGVVDASPEEVWNLFIEWGAISRWMKAPPSTKEVARSELLPGQTEADLPRTRLVQFAGPDASEPQVPETLLHADPQTRTLYYRVEGVRPSGYRNYLCYVTIDAHENGTMLRLNARMDAPIGQAKAVQQALQTIHAQGIIQAFREYLAKAR